MNDGNYSSADVHEQGAAAGRFLNAGISVNNGFASCRLTYMDNGIIQVYGNLNGPLDGVLDRLRAISPLLKEAKYAADMKSAPRIEALRELGIEISRDSIIKA